MLTSSSEAAGHAERARGRKSHTSTIRTRRGDGFSPTRPRDVTIVPHAQSRALCADRTEIRLPRALQPSKLPPKPRLHQLVDRAARTLLPTARTSMWTAAGSAQRAASLRAVACRGVAAVKPQAARPTPLCIMRELCKRCKSVNSKVSVSLHIVAARRNPSTLSYDGLRSYVRCVYSWRCKIPAGSR